MEHSTASEPVVKKNTLSNPAGARLRRYSASRARSSQIGAWASDQSRELPDRLALERRIAQMGLKYGLGAVPRPPHWSGFRLAPRAIEFWRDRPFRLHERQAFERADGGWTVKRLYP